MIRFGKVSKRLWRPFLGVVMAYAVAAQSLLIALGGFALPAHAGNESPAFELCLHHGQAAPDLPASAPGPAGCSHCIFCFAGSHHALIGSPPALFHRVDVEIADTLRAADKHCLARLSAYSIANPRGPPLGA
jgi:hypothetical protein